MDFWSSSSPIVKIPLMVKVQAPLPIILTVMKLFPSCVLNWMWVGDGSKQQGNNCTSLTKYLENKICDPMKQYGRNNNREILMWIGSLHSCLGLVLGHMATLTCHNSVEMEDPYLQCSFLKLVLLLQTYILRSSSPTNNWIFPSKRK